ncbi:MAG: ATP-binding cassette domain-containing protein [Nitriliruptorales bacterium]|nr:ATP-binding cassette domain-containing protein [Nitriliruptorales bacterium]
MVDAPAIRVRGAVRHFDGVPAVDGVDLDVRRGQVLALLGPSGCGKTTMLRLLAGFERPIAGAISVDGVQVAGPRTWVPAEARRMGMVFQDYALFSHLDVAGNVAFGLPRPGRLRSRSRAERVREVIDLVGLAGLEDRKPHELSGGQQQRVALARALAPGPPVLLLDEPFSNLDASLRAQVRTELVRILAVTGVTAVLVTHDQEEALSVADDVAVMRRGRILQQATPEVLYHRPHDRSIAAFVGDAEFLPGQSRGERVLTELGELPLHHTAHGPVEVLLRPEALRLVPDPDGRAVVVAREFYGHDQMLALRMDNGRALRARVGPITPLHPGQRCTVEVDGPVSAYPAQH